MIQIGDIVKHYNKRNDRFGVVVDIDSSGAILVNWFNDNDERVYRNHYRYYDYALVKVSQ